MSSTLSQRLVSLTIVLLVWSSARMVFFEGFWGYDDLSHVIFAVQPHVPVEVFECRWLYNVGLIAAFEYLGFSEWTAALPTLAASLLMVLTVWHVTGSRFGQRYACMAGVLLSLVALDVSQSTVPMANPLAAALAGLGTVVAVRAARGRDWILSGVLLGLAVNTHLATAFYFGPLLVVMFVARTGRERFIGPAAILAATIVTFVAVEVGLAKQFADDPMHRLHIIESTHLSTQVKYIPVMSEDGSLNPNWLIWPARQFVCSRELGLVLCLAVFGGLCCWRKLDAVSRTLLGLVLFSWLYINFGTQHPGQYAPLDHQVRYWYPLLVPLVLLAVSVAKHLEFSPRVRQGYLAGLFLPLPLMLSLAGPWGQNVEVSRELLAWAACHPDEQFVTDIHTYEEFFMLAGCRRPANVTVWGEESSSYVDVPIRRPGAGDPAWLINPLNLERPRSEAFSEFARARLHVSALAPPRPRSLLRCLPLNWPGIRSLAQRKPAAGLGRMSPPQVQNLSSSAWTTRSR